MNLVKRTGITDKERVLQKLQELGYRDLYIWQDAPNSFYNWHTHPYEEVRWILEGEIVIGTEEGEYLLKAGDLMFVPAGTRHYAKVGKNGVVYVCGSKY